MTSVFNPFRMPEAQPVNNYIQESAYWLQRYKLVINDTHAKCIASVGAEYIANCYPAIKPYQAQDLIDFASWVCILDDFIERESLTEDISQLMIFLNVVRYVCEEPNYARPSDFAFFKDCCLTKALVDIKSRIKTWASPSQVHNLMTSLSHFISGLGWETSLRACGGPPDLNTFCAMRTNNGGMYMANALAKCVNNIELSNAEQADPIIQVITKSILFVLVLDNDIYSYNKELSSGLPYSNIIDVFQLEYPESDKQNPLSRTVELRNQCLMCYLALRTKYPYNSEKLSLYFQGLEDIISGNLVFGNSNERYKVSDIDAPELTVSKTFEKNIFPPDNIPSIAWWWSFLE